jgi:3'-5' exoribonuclease
MLLGGLIEHTLSIVGMAEKAASHYPLIDRDMLIASALLHDLAKMKFIRRPLAIPRGRLVGHLVLGSSWCARRWMVDGVGVEQVDQLMHTILDHLASTVLVLGLPMTPEAICSIVQTISTR